MGAGAAAVAVALLVLTAAYNAGTLADGLAGLWRTFRDLIRR